MVHKFWFLFLGEAGISGVGGGCFAEEDSSGTCGDDSYKG